MKLKITHGSLLTHEEGALGVVHSCTGQLDSDYIIADYSRRSQSMSSSNMFSTLSEWLLGPKSTSNWQESTTVHQAPTYSVHQDVPYKAPEFNIDDYRSIKVRCIGAGFSGILSAIR